MTAKPEKAVSHLSALDSFAFATLKELLFWDIYFKALREPKLKGAVPHDDPRTHDEIINGLKKQNVMVKDYEIDPDKYKRYMSEAEYRNFPSYRKAGGGGAHNFIEKTLEHYLAAKFLNLTKDDIYIDVGSADSPAPEIYRKLYGCKTFRQDIMFPETIHGNIIGGDACNMPVEAEFATKIGLHCSFEHFEQDSDINFIREASRTLKKGGILCILPLYLFNKYVIQTNPASMPKGGIPFEKDVTLYCVKNWSSRHNRFYDVPHYISRIRNNATPFEMTVYVIRNKKQISPSCYITFAAVFKKK